MSDLPDPDDDQRRADHYQRVVAAVVARTGPLLVTPSQFSAARPGDLSSVLVPDLSGDPHQPGPRDDPMAFVLPEHLTTAGITTAEERIVAVLTEHADAEPAEQARAVLTALGLPVNTRIDLPGAHR